MHFDGGRIHRVTQRLQQLPKHLLGHHRTAVLGQGHQQLELASRQGQQLAIQPGLVRARRHRQLAQFPQLAGLLAVAAVHGPHP